MEAAVRAAEARLAAAGVALTLGGEPTYVPFDPKGPEWSTCADGPTKLEVARRLARDLQRHVWPGSTLLYCPGKRYDGEVNPRWSLKLISGPAGTPPVRWPGPCQPDLEGRTPDRNGALAWLDRLGEQLGADLKALELVDPRDPARSVWAVPLSTNAGGPDPRTGRIPWTAVAWELEPAQRQLNQAFGPAGLRLPLQHFPGDVPRQVLTVEIHPSGWELFLPPLCRVPLEHLLQAVADSLGTLGAPALGAMLPVDCQSHWQVLGLTADPGVLEVNLPVCRSWSDYRHWLEQLEEAGQRTGLRSWKRSPAGAQTGTGGGNHLLWGGPDLERHPFFSRPAWMVGILRYWQRHPALGYLFSGPCVGPASQAPRPDEAAGEIFDLELAYRTLEQADRVPDPTAPFGDRRVLIGETLRHLHADRGGNNHRSEISFDKFWNPEAPGGCQGLMEFRALESLPRATWSAAVAALWSALAAHLLSPEHRPTSLKVWGRELHDRMLLPSQLWSDLGDILATLAADGLDLDAAPFRELWQWRFPPMLHWGEGSLQLEIRPALEPWPLICDVPREGGLTSRFIDGSLARFELVASDAFLRECHLVLNRRRLPFREGLNAVRYRRQRLHPCLHPAIPPHLPLDLVIEAPSGCHAFRLMEDSDGFVAVGEPPNGAMGKEALGVWQGRQHPADVTIDLRL